jgi:hypothetical protein
MKTRLLAPLLALALLVFVSAGLAHEDQDHGHRGPGAHVHGLGRLDVAQEGSEVHLRLEVPAASVVGFEYLPRRDLEHTALDKAVAALKDGAALFRLSESAGCTLAEASLESPLLGHTGEAGGHDHDHEDEAAGEAGAGDHGHAHAAEGHADIVAEYRFFCARPAELREIRVKLFERFPATLRLQAQVATEGGQGGAELTPANPVLKL